MLQISVAFIYKTISIPLKAEGYPGGSSVHSHQAEQVETQRESEATIKTQTHSTKRLPPD